MNEPTSLAQTIEPMTDTSTDKLGRPVDEVTLNIDYQIIEHFSQHLYGSPNKAVEELVANGFDAFATSVHIYLPGKFTDDKVVVWDNGTAMDVEGLKQLWWIARSPKENGDRIVRGDGRERKLIGKFGIGKLASYAVGKRITHLCRQEDRFYLVSIDYKQIDGEDGNKISSSNPFRTPIYELNESEARAFVHDCFNESVKPAGVTNVFDLPTWTLASISELKKEISRGRLAWLLGTGMPLRPDFQVSVDDEVVTGKLETGARVHWGLDNPEVRKALETTWERALKDGKVDGKLTFGQENVDGAEEVAQQMAFVDLPYLGRMTCDIRVFDQSLITGKASELGRSYGFFLMVRGRLVNPDDEFLMLNDPSFGSFYRSQFVIRIDEDRDLLADRERLRRDTPGTTELAVVQSALYRVARVEIERDDETEAQKEKSESLLPIRSREYYREPLTALLMKGSFGDEVAFNVSRPKIHRKPAGDSEPMAILSPDGDGFLINTTHPLYVSLERRLGRGKKAQMFFRALDLLSISERLLEGYLYDIGISDEKVKQVMQWRNDLLRKLAENYERLPSDLALDLLNSSFEGNASFENALTAILRDMGFNCERDGASGHKDVLLVATIGPETYRLTFEPKGSIKALPNDKAEISGAAAHCVEAEAEHAIVVAREFVGFSKDSDNMEAAVLKECFQAKTVSIMTVEAIIELYHAIEEFGYPLDMIRSIFTTIETPKAKLDRIRLLRMPTAAFDFKGLLEDIWMRQGKEALGDSVPYKHVHQSNDEWKRLKFDEFEAKLVALETLSAGRILVNLDRREIVLKQAPEKIVDQIEKSLSNLAMGPSVRALSGIVASPVPSALPALVALQIPKAAPESKKLVKS